MSYITKLPQPTAANIRGSEGGGTVTLTSGDNRTQVFSLTADEVVVLPTTGVSAGDIWTMENPNAHALTIEASNTSIIITAFGARAVLIALVSTPTVASDWLVASREVLYGAAWTTYTPTINAGLVYTGLFQWRRVGENVETRMDIKMTSAYGAASGNFHVTLPSGLSLSSSSYPGGSIAPTGPFSWSRIASSNVFQGVSIWDGVNPASGLYFNSGYSASGTGGFGSIIVPASDIGGNDFLGFLASFRCDQFIW